MRSLVPPIPPRELRVIVAPEEPTFLWTGAERPVRQNWIDNETWEFVEFLPVGLRGWQDGVVLRKRKGQALEVLNDEAGPAKRRPIARPGFSTHCHSANASKRAITAPIAKPNAPVMPSCFASTLNGIE